MGCRKRYGIARQELERCARAYPNSIPASRGGDERMGFPCCCATIARRPASLLRDGLRDGLRDCYITVARLLRDYVTASYARPQPNAPCPPTSSSPAGVFPVASAGDSVPSRQSLAHSAIAPQVRSAQ
jgi:hypothetical protein